MGPTHGSEEKKKGLPGLQKIAFLSKVSLEVMAGAYGVMNPSAASLGLAVSVPLIGAVSESVNSINMPASLEEEYYHAMNAALERTKQCFAHSNSTLKVLEELSEYEVEFDVTLENVIAKTEAYQLQYMNRNDVTAIMEIFERELNTILPEYRKLKDYRLITGNASILEILKKAQLVLAMNGEKLDQVLELTKPLQDGLERIDTNVLGIQKEMTRMEQLLDSGLQFVKKAVDVVEKSIVTTFAFLLLYNIFLLGSEELQPVNIWLIMLLSEGLLRVSGHNVKNWKKFIYVTLIQTLMITVACAIVLYLDYLELLKVLIFGFAGVLVKNLLVVFAESDHQ